MWLIWFDVAICPFRQFYEIDLHPSVRHRWWESYLTHPYPMTDPCMLVCQNLVPLVNIKIAGKWIIIPLKMVLIGIDPSHMDVMGPAAQLSDPGLSLQDFYRQHVQRNLHGSSQENHNFLVKSPIFPPRNLPFFLFFPGEKRRLFLRPSSRTEAQDPGQRGPGEEPETQRAAGDTCNEKRFPWRIFVIIVMI